MALHEWRNTKWDYPTRRTSTQTAMAGGVDSKLQEERSLHVLPAVCSSPPSSHPPAARGSLHSCAHEQTGGGKKTIQEPDSAAEVRSTPGPALRDAQLL